MKKFYYIHGFNGDGIAKSKHLSEILGVEVTPLCYDSSVDFKTNLDSLLNYFNQEDKSEGKNVIIASSLGCFYAIALFLEIGSGTILRLFNPCLNPKTALPKVGCDENLANSYDYDFYRLPYWSDVKFFVSKQDEVLKNNLEIVKEFCVNIKQIYTNLEKHQINDFSKYKDEILKFRKNKFNKNDVKKLKVINERLRAFETKISNFSISQKNMLQENGDFKHYYSDFEIYFFDNKDEIITIDKTNPVSRILDDSNMFDDWMHGEDYIEYPKNEPHLFKHCWLYHCLFDHNGIDFTDILDIKRIRAKEYCSIQCAMQDVNIKQSKPESFSSFYDYSYENRLEILKINDILQKFQDILIHKAIFYENELKKELKNGFIKGFDIGFSVHFYLRTDDPAYDSPTGNNIVALLREQVKDIEQEIKKPKFQNRWLTNYNYYAGSDCNNRHLDLCYLFDSLGLNEFSDIFRIGNIVLDLDFNRYFDI